jgi:hypothetical protein
VSPTAVFIFVTAIVGRSLAADAPRAYVYFGADRERISERGFLDAKGIEGAQIRYSWKQLEHAMGEYDFADIRKDLDFLTAHGKRLFIQIQDVSFDPNRKPFPAYLLNDPAYHGGADLQYTIENDDEDKAKPAGWVARRWDPAVRERWHKLIEALGKEFDGKIEGINLAETAIDIGETGKLYPRDFTPDKYRDAIIANMAALKRAFPKSVAMQYANFMPEAKDAAEPRNLRRIYQAAAELKVALGGPDLLPEKPWQMRNSYPLLREFAGKVPTGIAVQDGNYGHINPKTKKQVTIAELQRFATDYLRVRYIFWCTEEPFYTRDMLSAYRD